MTQETSSNLFELQIDQQAASYLGETAKWAKFLAIIGFICIGLFLLFGIFAGSFFSNFARTMTNESVYPGSSTAAAGFSGVFMFVFIICALIYFFPCLYLYRYASKMQQALRSNDQPTLVQAFSNHKSFYKFIGILMIISLSLFLLEIIFGILMVGFR